LKQDGVIDKKKIYPACLPTRAHLNKRGILAGWADPLEFGFFYPENSPGGSSTVEENINEYREKHLIMKHIELEVGKCKDPEWMGSSSYHPKGTICGFDPSRGSCFDTGDSGSGLLVKRMQKGYSWEGPLSFYRGCQNEFLSFGQSVQTGLAFYVGENPGVFTEGACYLKWIADQYGLTLAKGYNTKCTEASGSIKDSNKNVCQASNGQQCAFNTGLAINTTPRGFLVGVNASGISMDKCLLGAQSHSLVQMNYWCPTLPHNIECYRDLGLDFNNLLIGDGPVAISEAFESCNGSYKDIISPCANNCRGVDGSGIIVGGVAVLASSAIAATSTTVSLAPLALTMLGVGTISAGGMAVTRAACMGPFYCTTQQNTCCLVVFDPNGRIFCPPNC